MSPVPTPGGDGEAIRYVVRWQSRSGQRSELLFDDPGRAQAFAAQKQRDAYVSSCQLDEVAYPDGRLAQL